MRPKQIWDTLSHLFTLDGEEGPEPAPGPSASERGAAGEDEPATVFPENDNSEKLPQLHHQMIGQQLYQYSLARFLVAGGIVGGTLFARYAVGVENLDVGGLLTLAFCLLVYDLAVFGFVRRYRDMVITPAARRLLVGVMNATILLDYGFLTVTLWLAGGTQSPFKVFYIFHVILACFLLPKRMAYAHAVLGYLMFAGLVASEWLGWIGAHYPVGAVASLAPIQGRYAVTVLAAQGMGVAVTLYFVVGLTQRLRRGEAELLRANEKIRRFSEMQRSYLHLAIHDVKAPVGAAQTFLNNLEEGLAEPLGPKQAAMVEGAQRRLSALSQLLRDFEVLAALDTVELDRQEHVLHAAEMVRNIVRDNQDLAQMHHHELRADIPGDLPPIPGIERLLSECVSNLLTNAIKYTPDGGKITVRAVPRGSWVRFEVQDNGIGIGLADQKRLFRDFVRIRRKDTGLPARAGSGLGLSIVRRIAEMHGGRAGVQSELNKGSTFFIELPLL